MRDTPFFFRGTEMVVRATTAETGAYALIEMRHPPDVGPALHVHPGGAEAFVLLDGAYTFHRGTEIVSAVAGQTVVIPRGVPHRYVSGPVGGRALVVTPPDLECYFWEAAQRLVAGALSLDEEFALAARYGQDFLDRAGHWGGR